MFSTLNYRISNNMCIWRHKLCKGPVLKSFMRQVAIIEAHGFCKRCVVSWYLPQRAKKKLGAFFVNVLSWTISSWKFFHKCGTRNLIYGIINVKKIFRALHCQQSGKYFKKKIITEHLRKKKHIIFFSFKLKISRFQTHFIKSKTW